MEERSQSHYFLLGEAALRGVYFHFVVMNMSKFFTKSAPSGYRIYIKKSIILPICDAVEITNVSH